MPDRLPAAGPRSRAQPAWQALDRRCISTRIASQRGNLGVAMSLIAALIIGAIAGWLAGKIVHGAGFGLIGNIVVGIIGALVASFLLPALGVSLGIGWVRDIINATIGAVVVLVILSLVRRA